MTHKTTDIKKATRWLKEGKEVAYVIDNKNKFQLFTFAYWQLKYKTLKSFKVIIYDKNPDLLFYMLKLASFLSFGHYKLYRECP